MLYANAKKRQFIPTPGNNETQSVSLRPILIYGTKLYLDILFCDDAGEPLEFSESDTFECAGDINFTHSDDLMFYSGPERCFLTDVPGVIRFEIYTNTTAFQTKAGEKATQSTIHFQVRRYLAGETLPDTILQDTLYALGSVMGLDDNAPEIPDPEYYTSAQIRALLNAGYEMEFSADGESWHTEQTDGDLYYHYRNRQIGGEWSDKIMIPKGEQGDPAPELKTQYSVDGSTLWHDEYAVDDAYMRTSSDNGGSWSTAIRILGPQGADGTDGKSAYQLWLEQEGNEGKSLDDFFNAYRGSDGTGLTVRGAYDAASTYQKTDTATDAVQYNGSLWGYINAAAGSGNAPPESAATVSNDYWTLLVAKGETGSDGRGIVSVEKTGTSGNVDTYTITYTDETTSTFTVTNGTNGSDGLTPEIDPDTKHWMIGGSDTGVVAEAKLEGGTAEITEVADNIATLSGTNVPVGVRTNSGTYYPIEKGSVVIDITNGQIKLDVTPYLAYDNAASFTGPWTVYYAAGSKGDKGDNALSFQIGTVTTLAAGASATAEAAISDEGLVTLNLGIPQGANGADGEDADATAAIDAHNSDASAHTAIQNKFASYLPLAGGTMTGVINRNGALVQNTVSGGSVSLIASHTGATEKGAALYLWDEANSTYPGYFILRAGHTSGYSDLMGTAPGGLTWRGASLIGECSKTMNGYTKLPNGIIIQWGSTSSTDSSVSATFPVAFTAAPIVIPHSPSAGVGIAVSATTTSATFTISSGSINVRYIAIGY